jgi:hypothetical protein
MRNRLRKFIAIVQLYGAVGLLYLIAEALWRHPLNFGLVAVSGICLAFAAVAVLGGIRLWQNKDLGIQLSFITQLVQLLTLTSSFVSYTAVLGAAVWVGISVSESGPNLVFDFVVGYSAFMFNIAVASTELAVRVNLVAGVLALFLLNERFHPSSVPSNP